MVETGQFDWNGRINAHLGGEGTRWRSATTIINGLDSVFVEAAEANVPRSRLMDARMGIARSLRSIASRRFINDTLVDVGIVYLGYGLTDVTNGISIPVAWGLAGLNELRSVIGAGRLTAASLRHGSEARAIRRTFETPRGK